MAQRLQQRVTTLKIRPRLPLPPAVPAEISKKSQGNEPTTCHWLFTDWQIIAESIMAWRPLDKPLGRFAGLHLPNVGNKLRKLPWCSKGFTEDRPARNLRRCRPALLHDEIRHVILSGSVLPSQLRKTEDLLFVRLFMACAHVLIAKIYVRARRTRILVPTFSHENWMKTG